jgi:segregation and condensation protein B
LLEKELIVIAGRNEQAVGKPLVYATSRQFMDYFGINSADELPKINEVLADTMVEPTLVNADHFDVEAQEMNTAEGTRQEAQDNTMQDGTDTEQ